MKFALSFAVAVFIATFSTGAIAQSVCADRLTEQPAWCNTQTATTTTIRNKKGQRTQVVTPSFKVSSGGGHVIAKARRYIGMNAKQIGLKRHTLWCAAFLNYVLGGGTRSDMAASYEKYGSPAAKGCVGCIALISNRGKRIGHVGIVTGYEGNKVTIVSGNSYRGRVYEGQYSAASIIGYRNI